MSAEVIYVCMNDACDYPWAPSAQACPRCGYELLPAIVHAFTPGDRLEAAVARALPKLADVALVCRDFGHDGLADDVATIAADLKRAKDGMP